MNYKEKYEQALERARKLQETCDNTAIVGWMEYIFPELKESENEKIRKAIRLILIATEDDQKDFYETHKLTRKELTDWLEKQGEKQPVTIDVDALVDKFSRTKVKGYGLPCMIEIDAYRKGIQDTLNIGLNIERQKPVEEVRTTGFWNVQDVPFDYSNANIKQKDWAEIPFDELIERHIPIPDSCTAEIKDGWVIIKKLDI